MLPETSDGILLTGVPAAPADEYVDDLTTGGVEWLHTTTEGVATGWYV